MQLVATLLPCPCGSLGDPLTPCQCEQEATRQYARQLSERLCNCFEMQVEVVYLSSERLVSLHPEESSAQVSSRVKRARALQSDRYRQASHLEVNADLRSAEEVEQYCPLDASAHTLLAAAIRQLHLTPAQVLSFKRVARTIADLAQREIIGATHLAEAIWYRPGLSSNNQTK